MDPLELVKKFLSPYLPLLQLAIEEAWKDYQENYSKNAHKLSSLAPSVIMNALVVNYAKKYCDSYNNIEIKKNSHSSLFIIRSSTENFRIDLRFKKLDKYFRTQNAKSFRNNNFVNQVYEPFLGGELQPISQTRMNINGGFQISEAWDSIECWITCPNGAKSIAWKFRMNDNESAIQITENIPDTPQITPSKKRIEATKIPEKQKHIVAK